MNDTSRHQYDNAFAPTNVYGHALALLCQYVPQRGRDFVHLDVGCGYGRIAEPLTEALGLTYVGFDADQSELESLAGRGFETHRLTLGEETANIEALRAAVGGRKVASISMLDTLEHLTNGDAALRALRAIASEHGAVIVLSVPNVAHRDLGYKLAFGLWDYTPAGLLDTTHTRLFGPDELDRTLHRAGLHSVASNDVLRASSDQAFPPHHPVLAEHSLLRQYLKNLTDQAVTAATVNQFVRLCLPGPVLPEPERDDGSKRPFLSIVTRTQGRRPHTMAELLTALTAQTVTDFELIIVGHRLAEQRQRALEQQILDTPEWMRNRIRLVLVDEGNRTRPLNVGFAAARGHYISIIDDDDLPFAHWVETFQKLAARNYGRLLRAVTVLQNTVITEMGGVEGVRATGEFERRYPPHFDVVSHLRSNSSPTCCLSFPAGVFHHLNIRFDESLTTTEDWDYIVRVAGVVGVASSPEITSIYRWWETEHSSRDEHDSHEWWYNYHRILHKLDRSAILMPAGTTARIRGLLEEAERAGSGEASAAELADRRMRDRFNQLVVAGKYEEGWALARALDLEKTPALDPEFTETLTKDDIDLLFQFAVLNLHATGSVETARSQFARVRDIIGPDQFLFWPALSGEIEACERLDDREGLEGLIKQALDSAGQTVSRVPREVAQSLFVRLVNSGRYADASAFAERVGLEEPRGGEMTRGDRDALFTMGILELNTGGDGKLAEERFARVREATPPEDELYWAALEGEMIAVSRSKDEQTALQFAREAIRDVPEGNIPSNWRERLLSTASPR